MSVLIDIGFVIYGTDANPIDGVSDVVFCSTGSGEYIYIASEAVGAVSVYDISGSGAPVLSDRVDYSATSGTQTLSDLVLAPSDVGMRLVTLGRYDDNYGYYQIAANGDLTSLPGGTGSAGTVGDAFDKGSYTLLFTAQWNLPGFTVSKLWADGTCTDVQTVLDDETRYLGDVTAIHYARLQGRNMLFTASAFDSGINSFNILGNDTVALSDGMDPLEGAGFARISDIDSLQIGNRAFIIVAGSQSDTLSVIRVSAGNQMNLIDTERDRLDTRFEGVQAIETFQTAERSFVIAGGGDDGISLFEVTYRGKLVHLETVADGFDTTLRNISSLSVDVVGETAHVYVGSAAEHGVTELIIDLSRSGQDIRGGVAAEALTGTSGDDVIWGMGHSDQLFGGGGNDRLIDGRGRDTMTGGAGADIFEFLDDGRSDFVTDFQPGIDRIDLTSLSNVDHFDDVFVGARQNGAVILVGDEVIRLNNPDGGPYDISLITEDSFIFG